MLAHRRNACVCLAMRHRPDNAQALSPLYSRRAPSSSSSAIWKSASRRKMARALATSVRSTVAAPAACRSSLPARVSGFSEGTSQRVRRKMACPWGSSVRSSVAARAACRSCLRVLSQQSAGWRSPYGRALNLVYLPGSILANAASASCAIRHTRGSMHGAGIAVRDYAR